MEFHDYATFWDCARRSVPKHLLGRDSKLFYRMLVSDACHSGDVRTAVQAIKELDWEGLRRPFYNVYPGIIPMLTRLNLDMETTLIQLPMSSLCIRFPKDPAKNPLKFDWKGEQLHVHTILLGDIGGGMGMSLHFDIGMHGPADWPLNGCCGLPRQPGLSVEQSLASLIRRKGTDDEVWLPVALLTDCVRLCCTLCLLDNDPSIISPDVLADDRMRYEVTGDQKFVDKAHRKGKVGWDIGRHIEKIPHYRRPHMALYWTGPGGKIPKVRPRKGSVIHREKVETIPTGFLGNAGHTMEAPVPNQQPS